MKEISHISIENAEKFMKEVDFLDHLEVIVQNQMSGRTSNFIISLEQLDRFMHGMSRDELIQSIFKTGIKSSLNYVNLEKAIVWIHEQIGDHELADEIAVIQRNGEMDFVAKQHAAAEVISQRLVQYKEVLKPA